MATRVTATVLHIDETLEQWQRNILDEHLHLQDAVIGTGYNNDKSHLMIIAYNPQRAHPKRFISMVERHGYHAERIG